jgi:hypothetical protein
VSHFYGGFVPDDVLCQECNRNSTQPVDPLRAAAQHEGERAAWLEAKQGQRLSRAMQAGLIKRVMSMEDIGTWYLSHRRRKGGLAKRETPLISGFFVHPNYLLNEKSKILSP